MQTILGSLVLGTADTIYNSDGIINDTREVEIDGGLEFTGGGDISIEPETTFTGGVEIDGTRLLVSNTDLTVSSGDFFVKDSVLFIDSGSHVAWESNPPFNAPTQVQLNGVVTDLNSYSYSLGHVLPTALAVKDYVGDEISDIETLYTNNGVLSGTRIVTMGSNSLIFSGNTGVANITSEGTVVSTSTTSNFQAFNSTNQRYIRLNDGTNTMDIFSNSGTPEGDHAADKGSLSIDSTNSDLYIKTTDTVVTGWERLVKSSDAVIVKLHDPSFINYRNIDELDWGYGNDTDAINNSVAYKAISCLNGIKTIHATGAGTAIYASKYELANIVGHTTVMDAKTVSTYYTDAINGGTTNQGIFESYAISQTSSRFFKRVVEQTAYPSTYLAFVQTSNKLYLDGIRTPTDSGNSAILDIDSATQGVLLPRMTTTQVNAIATPATGLVVYNTTLNQLCFYNGTEWRKTTDSTM